MVAKKPNNSGQPEKRKAGRPFSLNPRIFRLGGVRLTETEMQTLEQAHVVDKPESAFAPWVRHIVLTYANQVLAHGTKKRRTKKR